MEEFFKGLAERARYYEQFESFRASYVSRQLSEIPEAIPEKGPKAKVLLLNL
jgi:hypothetical protein